MSKGYSAGDTWKNLFVFVESVRNYQARTLPMRKPGEKELSFPQVRVLGTVFMSQSGSVRVKDIAEELGITPGAVSQSVDHLVARGLLERSQDPNDRRAVCITLSGYGREIHSILNGAFDMLFTHLLLDIEEEKIEIFNEVLAKMRHNLEQEKTSQRKLK